MRLGIGETAKERSFARDAVAGRDAFSDQGNFTPYTSHFSS